MRKFLAIVVLLCFISLLSFVKESVAMGQRQCPFPGSAKTDKVTGEEAGAKELDLGEPTEKEASEMERESEWTEEEEDDYPSFDGDVDGSTQAMQDF